MVRPESPRDTSSYAFHATKRDTQRYTPRVRRPRRRPLDALSARATRRATLSYARECRAALR